jgi:hypothetical protein
VALAGKNHVEVIASQRFKGIATVQAIVDDATGGLQQTVPTVVNGGIRIDEEQGVRVHGILFDMLRV